MKRTSIHFSAYLPSFFAFALAYIFLRVPALAALLVSGALLVFAVGYALLIHKLSALRRSFPSEQEDPLGNNPPGFRQVTVEMFRRGGTWIKQVPDRDEPR
jgi:hypothetical protein